jgi:diaminopimelate epimerase
MAVTAGEQIELRGLTVATDAGRKQLCCWVVDGAVRWVTADMGVASLRLADMSCTLRGETAVDREVEIGGRGYRLTCVAVGSLHAVIFVADPAAANLAEEGPAIERAAIFPERVNVHFVHCRSREILAMRTWERGSGATLACGTGSCAAVVAGVATGRTERKCAVHQPGGMVLVSADEDLLLSGPVETVCTGTWHAPPATVPD